MAANVWDNSTVDGKWSTADNWSLGHVPTTTETATFDATSNTNCAIDAAVDCLGIDMNAGYTAVVTQGAVNVTLGTAGLDIASGTFTGVTSNWIYNYGDFVLSGVGVIGVEKMQMAFRKVNGTITKTMTATDAIMNAVRFEESTTVVTNSYWSGADALGADDFYLAPGKILTLDDRFHWYCKTSAGAFTNLGVINGAGTLRHYGRSTNFNKTVTWGIINCPVEIKTSSQVMVSTLARDTRFGSSLSLVSTHASNTLTLALAGHRLECESLIVGTRSNITGANDSSVFCTGKLTQSDATPVTICNGGFPFTASGGVTGMGQQSDYISNGHTMTRLLARNRPKYFHIKWGVMS